MALAYDNKLAAADATLTQDQLAARSQAATLPAPIVADKLLTPEVKTDLSSTIPTPGADTAGSLVAGAGETVKSVNEYIKLLTPPDSAEQTKSDELKNQISELLGQGTNQASDQLKAEQDAGIPKLKTDLTALNGEIQTKAAEYEALATAERGKPITMDSIIGTTAQIRYAKASEVGLLQARASALQGNLAAAQENVNRAIDLKYKTQEDTINIKLKQLSLLEGKLDKQEQIRADAIKLALNDQKEKLTEEKTNDKQLQTMGIQAASGGAPTSIVNQAIATKDPIEAAAILSNYLKGPTESTSGGTTEGTLFKVPTAKELGNAQFYKYPNSSQVYSSAGKNISLPQYKQLTGQTNVPDEQVNFSGIKTINPTSTGTGTSTPTPVANNKPITVSDRNKYSLPSYVNQGEFTNVKNAIRAVVQQAGSVTDANRYDLWQQVVDAMRDVKLDPSVWDALLWEAFSPAGLAGYKKNTTTSTSKSSPSLSDQINQAFN